jgi:hypothetical protein
MTRILRCGSLVGGLMLVLACGTGQPTAPSAVRIPPIIPQPPAPPPSGDPVGTYVFSGTLDHRISGFTAGSRYLLYDNGVFGLRYDAFDHVYLGTYRQDNATIIFSFGGGWTWDQGIAMGTLKGELLEVRYSDIMVHSDFENAVYRRSQ